MPWNLLSCPKHQLWHYSYIMTIIWWIKAFSFDSVLSWTIRILLDYFPLPHSEEIQTFTKRVLCIQALLFSLEWREMHINYCLGACEKFHVHAVVSSTWNLHFTEVPKLSWVEPSRQIAAIQSLLCNLLRSFSSSLLLISPSRRCCRFLKAVYLSSFSSRPLNRLEPLSHIPPPSYPSDLSPSSLLRCNLPGSYFKVSDTALKSFPWPSKMKNRLSCICSQGSCTWYSITGPAPSSVPSIHLWAMWAHLFILRTTKCQ